MAKGAKPKKRKGEMLWIPDYLVLVVKKIKEMEMSSIKEAFARSNTAEIIDIRSINEQGVKLLNDIFLYRGHLCIPTALPDRSLFGFKIFTIIDGEEIEDLDDPSFLPEPSLEKAITSAKLMIDLFFSLKEGNSVNL